MLVSRRQTGNKKYENSQYRHTLAQTLWYVSSDKSKSHNGTKKLEIVLKWDYHHDMKIIAIKTLRDFWTANPDAEQPLKAWVDEASKAEWKTPAEIKEQYRSASILKNRRVVFNIKGNDYRLIVAIAYQRGWMFIKFIGTHKEYDKIDAETVSLE